MITEFKIQNIDNLPIRINKAPEPRSVNKMLPPLYFSGMFIGSTGTGKTYSLVKLLKLYEQYPIYHHENNKLQMRCILFCPTANSSANPIFSTLKCLSDNDIILHYSDEKLEEKIEEIKEEEKLFKEENEYRKAYARFIKHDDINILTDDEVLLLEKNGYREPDKTKYPKVVFMVFDDLIGSDAFKRTKSKINFLVTQARHHKINMLFTTQYLTAIPPVIRSQIRVWVIFKFSNSDRVIQHVYPEISALIKEKEFLDLYEYATKSGHDSLILINHPLIDKKMRIRKNWDIVLDYN
mmetsp:Transcript_71734/g.191392  ORF Transcript_71734/g.191392 Transcript_71734/m.191392 type:complete len:295 (+) Transcript_71734:1577-2461(+)